MENWEIISNAIDCLEKSLLELNKLKAELVKNGCYEMAKDFRYITIEHEKNIAHVKKYKLNTNKITF